MPFMARARHMLLAFLAVAGLLSALGTSSASAACPLDSPIVSAQPDGCEHGSPMKHEVVQPCAVCLAVLPTVAAIEPSAAMPFPPTAALFSPLRNIDPGLDPPPPRAA